MTGYIKLGPIYCQVTFLEMLFPSIFLAFLALGASDQALPKLYEYYTGDGISSGLSADQPYFTLNGKNITILSGAMHYFRIPPQYWQDRLRKLRAAGLNAVETYVPWNLHEPQNGVFDFGDGGSDFEQFLDLQKYLQLAQEEDLFVILRPGPYICAEWEWGGLPSWLLAEAPDGLKVRTSETRYVNYVQRYFEKLLALITDLQFTEGGPIIAVQVENEYGSAPTKDLDYVQELYDIIRDAGIVELLVTSDGAGSGTSGSLPELLFQTVNFGSNPVGAFDALKKFQPDKPIMAMEYWTGWFDHWSENHHTVSGNTFREIYEAILSYPASANMYMFHGGTNWGFLNGGNLDNVYVDGDYQPTTTSYDYDAPLSEAGDYTDKYDIAAELIAKYNPVKTLIPDRPGLMERTAFPSVAITEYLSYDDITDQVTDVVESDTILYMETLPINNNSGQSYGYLVYRQENLDLPAGSVLTIDGHVRDTVMVLIDGTLVSQPLSSSDDFNGFGYWRPFGSNITLTDTDLKGVTVDIVVENWGRGNFGELYTQYKGMLHAASLNGEELSSWKMLPLEFKRVWNWALTGWRTVDGGLGAGPGLYKGVLTLDEKPAVDTFIDMSEWGKGIVIVNGFVLGRHASPIGPQQTLYLPAPFLMAGDNEILVFEHFEPAKEIKFAKDPIFRTP